MCYSFDDIMSFCDRDINFSDILLYEKLCKDKYENNLIYDISCNVHATSTCVKPLRIRFDEIDGFIKIHDGIRCIVLFDYGWLVIGLNNRIKYLISEKSGITDSINHNFAKIRIDSYNSFRIENILTFLNNIILIKSFVNKNKNNYYYNIRL